MMLDGPSPIKNPVLALKLGKDLIGFKGEYALLHILDNMLSDSIEGYMTIGWMRHKSELQSNESFHQYPSLVKVC